MKFIVACCWSPEKGQGISTMSREIAAYLAGNHHEVYYLAPQSDNISWYQKAGVTPIDIGPKLTPKDGLKAVVASVNKLQPDVLINNDHPYVQAALPAIGVKKIVISHTMAWATAALARFNHQYADRIIVISNDMLKQIVDKGVPSSKLALIMNGIVDPYSSTWNPSAVTDGPLKVVFAGNWTRVKGADLLLDAFANAQGEMDWIQFECFGAIKEKYSKRLTGKPWIKLHGRVARNQFLDTLAEADFLLLPSKIEGCPMTVIEAMSRGVVPLVSDGHGAMRWMVSHGIDGFVIRRKNWSQDMWEILHHMHNNRDALIKMKSRARGRFSKQFEISHMMAALIEVIAQIKNTTITTSNETYKTIHWHRPSVNDSMLNKVIDRVFYQTGILRMAGSVHRDEL